MKAMTIRVLLLMSVLLVSFCDAGGKSKLKIGCDTNFMPFEFQKDGKYVGFDIDLWDEIARELGVEYELQPMDFNGLIPALQSRSIDVAIAGMTITSQREKVVDFSYPYYRAGLMILVRKDDNSISTLADLNGKVVSTKLGTTSHDFIKKNVKAKHVALFPNIDGSYLELASGGADAVLFDSPALRYYANGSGKERVKVVGPLYMGQSYGMAFPQGSELRERVSIALLKLMEDGTYERIYAKWFGIVAER